MCVCVFAVWVWVMEETANLLAHLSQGKVNVEEKVFSVRDSLARRPRWADVIITPFSSFFFFVGLQLQHRRSWQSITMTVPFAGTPCNPHGNSLAATSSTSTFLGLDGDTWLWQGGEIWACLGVTAGWQAPNHQQSCDCWLPGSSGSAWNNKV